MNPSPKPPEGPGAGAAVEEAAPAPAPAPPGAGGIFAGAGWLAASKALAQAFSWLGTFYVASRLAPSDYGLSGLATAFTEFAVILTTIGIGATLVQRADLDRDRVDNLFTFTALVGVFLATVAWVVAPFGGWYFHNPAIIPLTRFTACIYLFSSLNIVPYNFLNRDMRFRVRGLIDVISTVISIGGQVALARLGFGVWTLMIGGALRAFAQMALSFRWAGYRPRFRLRWAELRDELKFSSQLTLNWLLFVLKKRVVFILLGRMFPVAELGLASFASTLAGIPNLKIVQLLRELLLPLLAKRQHAPASQLSGLATGMKVMLLGVLPLYLAGWWYGRVVLGHILAPKWAGMFALFEAACLLQGYEVLASVVSTYNTARAQPLRSTAYEFSLALAIPLATLALRGQDLLRLSYAWAALCFLAYHVWFAWLFRRDRGFLLGCFGLELEVAAVCALGFALDAWLVGRPGGPSPLPALGALGSVEVTSARVAAFSLLYAAYLAARHRRFLLGLRRK